MFREKIDLLISKASVDDQCYVIDNLNLFGENKNKYVKAALRESVFNDNSIIFDILDSEFMNIFDNLSKVAAKYGIELEQFQSAGKTRLYVDELFKSVYKER